MAKLYNLAAPGQSPWSDLKKRTRGLKGWVELALVMALLTTSVLMASGQAAESSECLDYNDYALVLKSYVNDKGMVNYKELKSHREQLDAFAKRLETLEPTVYSGWDDQKKIAFWLNAYNGFTLKAIIDHYPIKSSFFKARLYPKNSIRQISGVWDKLKFPVMGRKRTLDEIEHEILRKEFSEPRIHMALVCAAMGCPSLRNEPYTGERLDEQLNDQASRFLKDPLKFRVDRKKKRVYLSPIFKWFGEDFIPKYGTNDKFRDYDESAVLNFISGYLSEEIQGYLTAQELSVKHLDYDWSLNEQ